MKHQNVCPFTVNTLHLGQLCL